MSAQSERDLEDGAGGDYGGGAAMRFLYVA